MNQMFCATQAGLGRQACRWPRGQVVTWKVDKPIAKFPKRDYIEICRMAIAQWEAVCGIRFERATNGRANINITTRRIDARGGVLAEAQLPCGNVGPSTQLMVWVDTSEDWVHAANPPAGAMDLLRVLTHEFGHSIGMGHAPEGSRNLMAPTVSRIRAPQMNWDIPQSVVRYGDPSLTPPPTDCRAPEAREICDAIVSVLRDSNRQAFGETLGSIRKWLDRIAMLSEYWDEIQQLLECFEKLNPADRVKRLKTIDRMRKVKA